jgi:hypothetical protein
VTFLGDPREDARAADLDCGEGTLLYESGRTRVIRRQVSRPGTSQSSSGPGGAPGAATVEVIWKEPLGAGAADRIRHETGILAGLAAVPGVAHLVPTNEPYGFAAEDVGGVSLASTLTGPTGVARAVAPGPEVVDLVALALGLARVLSDVHQAGVTHQDINPANILITGSQRAPVLIDWDLATTFAQERPGFTHESSIVGTLAYLAPEQSGRTGGGEWISGRTCMRWAPPCTRSQWDTRPSAPVMHSP